MLSLVGQFNLNGEKIILAGIDSIVISGTPSVNITQTTQYPYQVTTDGSACAPQLVTGVIEVKPEELLTLVSGYRRYLCWNWDKYTKPIIYNGQEAVSAVVSFTPQHYQE